MLRRLFIPVREREQRRLRPGAAYEGKSGWQHLARVAHRHGDRREAGGRREELAVVAVRRVQVADQAGRVAPGRIDHRIQLTLIHRFDHRGADLRAVGGLGLARGRVRAVAGSLLGLLEAQLDRRVEPA